MVICDMTRFLRTTLLQVMAKYNARIKARYDNSIAREERRFKKVRTGQVDLIPRVGVGVRSARLTPPHVLGLTCDSCRLQIEEDKRLEEEKYARYRADPLMVRVEMAKRIQTC